jgi:hypothetical protein
MLMVRFSDFTDTLYTIFYRDTAGQIMDLPAEKLREYKIEGDNQAYTDAFQRQQYKKYKLLMRAKITSYAGGTKISYSAAKVMQYDIKHENAQLLDRLEIYSQKKDLSEIQNDLEKYNLQYEANYFGNGQIAHFFS